MLSNRERKLLRSLRLRKNREAEGFFLAEGVRVVEDLLASPLAVRLMVYSSSLEDSGRGRALVSETDRRGIPRRVVSDAELAGYTETETPQGVVAVAEIPRSGPSHLRGTAVPAVILVLDAVQDPGNFGTLVRTSEALGAVGVVMLPGTVDPWNPKAVRAAAGSSFRLPIVAADWADFEPWLRAHEFRILAADAGGARLGPGGPRRVALVVGNEGAGVSVETRALADQTVGIPLRGRAESLNVAAAAAILLYELLR